MKVRKKIKLDDMVAWTGARVISGSQKDRIGSISTDSRTLEQGDFFVPVAGENFDGHHFIGDAVTAGAGGLVYEKNKRPELPFASKDGDILVLEAEDTMDFLMKLAGGYIRQFPVVTIGITGSLGKTTCRSFITAILKKGFRVVHTPKNFNTEIGVSGTIFSIDSDTDFFVAELGMRGGGQIGPLSYTSNVKLGAITSISGSHMEFFDSIEELAAAKAEIAGPIMENGGKLFLNADDGMTPFIRRLSGADIIEFGADRARDYNFIGHESDLLGRYSFGLYRKGQKMLHVKPAVPGYHNMYNACLAAAVCHTAGAGAGMIKKGLEDACMEDHRMQIMQYGDMVIIDDCYNASPASVQAALDTLGHISGKRGKRSVAILGDMLELGDSAAVLHKETGKYAVKKDIDVLLTSGKLAKNICRGFMEAGKNSRACAAFDDKKELVKELENIVDTGDTILVKGSRAGKMEDIVGYLKKLAAGREADGDRCGA